jgi:hypothetical protein
VKAPAHEAKPRAQALTQREMLSAFVERATHNGPAERSSVALKTNARGEVQIEVTVRTGESPEVATVDDCAAKARAVFDVLRAFYPLDALAPAADARSTKASAAARAAAIASASS